MGIKEEPNRLVVSKIAGEQFPFSLSTRCSGCFKLTVGGLRNTDPTLVALYETKGNADAYDGPSRPIDRGEERRGESYKGRKPGPSPIRSEEIGEGEEGGGGKSTRRGPYLHVDVD